MIDVTSPFHSLTFLALLDSVTSHLNGSYVSRSGAAGLAEVPGADNSCANATGLFICLRAVCTPIEVVGSQPLLTLVLLGLVVHPGQKFHEPRRPVQVYLAGYDGTLRFSRSALLFQALRTLG